MYSKLRKQLKDFPGRDRNNTGSAKSTRRNESLAEGFHLKVILLARRIPSHPLLVKLITPKWFKQQSFFMPGSLRSRN